MELTTQSDFSGIQANVKELLSSVESSGSNAGTIATTCANDLGSIQFGSWGDDVASNLNNYRNAVKDGMIEVATDIGSGQYTALVSAINDLIYGLGCCITYRSNIDQATEELSHTVEYREEWVNPDWRPIYQGGTGGTSEKRRVYNPRYSQLQTMIADNNTYLEDAVRNCIGIGDIIQSITYNGNITYQPAYFAAAEEYTPPTEEFDANSQTDVDTLAYAAPSRSVMEEGGTYSKNGGKDGQHFTTYQDYLDWSRKYNMDPDDRYNIVANGDISIAEFNYPPYSNGINQYNRAEVEACIRYWQERDSSNSQVRSRLGQ